MKSLYKITLSLGIAISVALACKPESLVDEGFALYYPGVSGLAPSAFENVEPTWHGDRPEDFEVIGVTFNGVPHTTDCFSIQPKTGVLSIHDTDNLPIGHYVVGIACVSAGVRYTFENAVSVDVAPIPMRLSYVPNQEHVEAGAAFSSSEPVVTGTRNGLRFALKSVEPAEAPVSVNAETGVISLPEGHTLAVGTQLSVSLTLTNDFSQADFDRAYAMTVVNFVRPVGAFSYVSGTEVYQGQAFSVAVSEIEGDNVQYGWAGEPPVGLEALTLDPLTGTLSFPADKLLQPGTYSLAVKAFNQKNEKTAYCNFTIIKNNFFFSTVRYGNNLGLTPAADYADQFRITSEQGTLSIPVLESDIPDGVPVLWTIDQLWSSSAITIDAQTGTLSVPYSTKRMTGYAIVTVKAGGDSPLATSKTIPVFFNHVIANMNAGIDGGVTILYTPFVFQCNPRKGGRSVAPVITGNGYSASNFAMDYRRSFNYYNLSGPASQASGTSESDGFLQHLWTQYYNGLGKAPNLRARDPMSAFSGNESLRLGYIDQSDFSLVVNPEKFKDDAGYAGGIFSGEIIFGTGNDDPLNGHNNNGNYPILIWLDSQF